MSMELVFGIASCLSGMYLIMIAFLMDVYNVKSMIVFKFTPFMLGWANMSMGVMILKPLLIQQ